jgi:hypothetical protein
MLICFALKEEAAPFRKIAAGGLRRSLHFQFLRSENNRRSLTP